MGDAVFVRTADVVSAVAGAETMMVNVRQGYYYGISGVAQSIWVALETPRTSDEIVELLLREYEVSREACAHETQLFLRQLIDEGLVRTVESGDL